MSQSNKNDTGKQEQHNANSTIEKPLSDRQQALFAQVQTFVETTLKPRFISPQSVNDTFPYRVDLSVAWRKKTLYFYVHYHDPAPIKADAETDYKRDYARLTYNADGTVNLAYQRHTGRYFMLYQRIPLKDCFAALMDDEILIPG